MGKVIVKIKLTNLKDAFLKTAGARKAKPREVEVEALVEHRRHPPLSQAQRHPRPRFGGGADCRFPNQQWACKSLGL